MSKILKITGQVVLGQLVEGKREDVVLDAGLDIELPDDEYGLTDDDVERIVRGNCGVLFDPDAVVADEQPAGVDEERMVELLDAIAELEEGNDAHWTKNHIPEIAALKEVTGGKVTAAERDAAWKAYNE